MYKLRTIRDIVRELNGLYPTKQFIHKFTKETITPTPIFVGVWFDLNNYFITCSDYWIFESKDFKQFNIYLKKELDINVQLQHVVYVNGLFKDKNCIKIVKR